MVKKTMAPSSPATEPVVLTLEYPALPPREWSPNYTGPWQRRYQVGLDVKNDVMVLLLQQGWHMEPLKHAKVHFKFGLPDKRRRDMDNLISASKPLLDILIGRVIQDDRIGAVEVQYSWFDSPKKACTIIEVSDAPST